MNSTGEHFGEARLLAAIVEDRSEPLQDGIANLLAQISRWHGAERPQDDISILAAELRPLES
jgi:hypothetical protein